MENVTDALKLAAWVLIFVLALSISISAFGQARTTSDAIISYRDRENDFFYVESTGNNRIVGIETIIPSMYRAYDEGYIIEFYENNMPKVLYKYDGSPITSVDDNLLKNQNIQIKDILYSTSSKNTDKIEYNDTSIYDYIKVKNFEEWLGEEIKEDTSQASQNNSVKKRIIRYKKVN